MKKKVINNSIHTISLASGILTKFKDRVMDITPDEEKRYAKYIEVHPVEDETDAQKNPAEENSAKGKKKRT